MSQDGTDFIQLVSRSGTMRGPAHSYQHPDLIQLHLARHERVVQVEWSRGHETPTRKTVDWTWTVWIESRLVAP